MECCKGTDHVLIMQKMMEKLHAVKKPNTKKINYEKHIFFFGNDNGIWG
jgi:hypothetical protein